MASQSTFDTHLTDQKVKTLVNAQLKSILKREKLAVSGLKVAMQNRIIGQLHNHARNRDMERLNRLKDLIHNPDSLQLPAPPLSSNHTAYHNFPTGPNLTPIMGPGASTLSKPNFKKSPFYTILESLTDVQECKVREATRDQAECKITLQSDVIDKLAADASIRVMMFCASEPVSHFSKVDIAFPHQVEVKVNMDEVKANLRGLKNRPGSTRPADITTLLRKRANYENSLSVTYVENILEQTPIFVDQVTVHPDGRWSRVATGDRSSRRSHNSSDGDEDLMEIRDPPRMMMVKNEISKDMYLMRTPPASSREQSSSSVPPTTGAKRAIIDLTSDNDDEDTQRSIKRSAIPTYPVKLNRTFSDSSHSQKAGNDIGSPLMNPMSSRSHYNGYPGPP
ncbi:MAG: hypothetical protein Q9219_007711 [cf. Caloplaca sp. 3 TL-2023]